MKNYQQIDTDNEEASQESVLIHIVPENKCKSDNCSFNQSSF